MKALDADSQAIALLCSSLAIPRGSTLKPLTPTEWNGIAQLIRDSEMPRPGALLGRTADDLATVLSLPANTAHRLADLLGRGGQLALELERLSNRGIWLLTRNDDEYPSKLRQRLGSGAPPLLFGAGSRSLLSRAGAAVVGSRNVDEDGLSFAAALARRCARDGLTVFSGGARGVDMAAMLAAIEAGGSAVGVLADSLERLAQRRELRGPLIEESLAIISPFHPSVPFNVGNAMRRNRLIYCLADAAVVVASDAEGGGTRAGALENLKRRWVPLHVRADGSPGNADLLCYGAVGITDETLSSEEPLRFGENERLPPSLFASDAADADHGRADLQPQQDPYHLVWPLLQPFLSEPRTAAEVGKAFALELPQARKWLKRATEEGAVVRIGNGNQTLEAHGQPRLWESKP